MIPINRQVPEEKRLANPYGQMVSRLHPAQGPTEGEGIARGKPVFVPCFSFRVPDIQQMPGKPVIIHEPGRPFSEQPIDRG